MMGEGRPLVTLGMPVRNGAAALRKALDSMVAQDYENIEIVISDNASDDDTPKILAEYQARFGNIRIIRQSKPLTAIDNFLFVLAEAQGEFFVWCAHDDTRSDDFVSGLLPAFEDPLTVLAFGDLYVWDGRSAPQFHPKYYFDTNNLPLAARLRKTANNQCYYTYGLWRLSALRAIKYRYTHWWSDLPIMLAAAALGTFRYVSGPRFFYYEVRKTPEQRAVYQDNREGNHRVKNFVALFGSIVITLSRTIGPWSAVLSIAYVAEKYAREAIRRVGSRLGSVA
jgi:glycosyltransferase involved in cell wall biosynthesis